MNEVHATRVLLIEDNRGDARLVREMFTEVEQHDFSLAHVESMRDARAYVAEHNVDIILLDLGLPDAQGLEVVRQAIALAPGVPLVILTGRDDESLASEALQEGAQDYLIKGQIETRSLLRAMRHAIERNDMQDERRVMEEALFAEKERAQVTLQSIGDAVICTDSMDNITFLNQVAERMTGWSLREAAGRRMADVVQILNASNRAPHPLVVPQGNGHAEANLILVSRTGLEIPIEESVAAIHDSSAKPTGAVVVVRDVTTLRAMTLEMTHSAHHDFLTKLPNRMLLHDRIGQAIAVAIRTKKQISVLFLDLDGFKHINDSLGHAVGDMLLQSVAARLTDCVRLSDTVSRQGGDEFVVLLSDLERAEDAAFAARRMLQSVANPHSIDGRDLHITASIGVSVYPDDASDTETLIKNADTAMYQAKENGRQGYRFFKPAMNVRAVQRQSIEEDLRRSLERNEFELRYQPKVDLATGTITGAEALLRWNHPVRGPMSPTVFIPIAEDCGLILPIGQWVLREACKQAQAWVDSGLPRATMAVNVSAMQFWQDRFFDGVLAILEETGLDPRLLEVELTESVLMRRASSSASILRRLRKAGVQVSVDDFGTGYSSLSYLHQFPLDALKIDRAFVGRIGVHEGDSAIVTAVINLAHNLKLQVIAEGVETKEQLDFLRERECDIAQGYYFSRPVTAKRFVTLLTEGLDPSARTQRARKGTSRATPALVNAAAA